MSVRRTVVFLTGAMTSADAAQFIEAREPLPRLHFNWGYHEGAQDKLHQKPRRMEFSGCGRSVAAATEYAAGYEYGWQDGLNGVYANDSTDAWQAHTARPESKQRKYLTTTAV